MNETLKIVGVARTPGGTPINGVRLSLQTTDLDGTTVAVGGSETITGPDGSFRAMAWYRQGQDQIYSFVATVHDHPCVVSPATVTVSEGVQVMDQDITINPADVTLSLVPDVSRDVPRMGEIGGRIASDLGAMQAELNRYPLAGGAFVIDQMELALPLVTVVDDLGQVRTRLAAPAEQSNAVRFLIRPVFDVPPQTLLAPSLPIEALDVLSDDQVQILRLRRVDDLAALAQVLGGPTASRALAASGFPLDELMSRLQLVLNSGLPTEVAIALIGLEITSVAAFATRAAEEIAAGLSRALPLPVSADKVAQWQREVRVRAGWDPTAPTRPVEF